LVTWFAGGNSTWDDAILCWTADTAFAGLTCVNSLLHPPFGADRAAMHGGLVSTVV
jgi:hypothetical protein